MSWGFPLMLPAAALLRKIGSDRGSPLLGSSSPDLYVPFGDLSFSLGQDVTQAQQRAGTKQRKVAPWCLQPPTSATRSSLHRALESHCLKFGTIITKCFKHSVFSTPPSSQLEHNLSSGGQMLKNRNYLKWLCNEMTTRGYEAGKKTKNMQKEFPLLFSKSQNVKKWESAMGDW